MVYYLARRLALIIGRLFVDSSLTLKGLLSGVEAEENPPENVDGAALN